jgi:ribokinase
MVRIALLASFNMDLVMRAARAPAAGETLQGEFSMFLGGKGFNQAVAARRMGAEVSVVGRVGDDEFGRAFLKALTAEGIDASGVAVDASAGTGVASIIVDATGENAILQSPRANRNITAADVRRAAAMIETADAALFQLELSDEGAREFAAIARDGGATVIFNPAPAAPVADEVLALCDIVVPNQFEARTLTAMPAETIDEAFTAAESLLARGPTTVVVTMGAQGAVALTPTSRLHTPAFAVDVVDTVGAGDAFCAGLAVALGRGDALENAMRFANAAGALACTRAGAEPSMPRLDEVDARMSKGAPA